MKWGLASSAGSDVPRQYADARGFGPAVRQHSLMGIGHEIISRAILSRLLFRVGQLSITGQRIYTMNWFKKWRIYKCKCLFLFLNNFKGDNKNQRTF